MVDPRHLVSTLPTHIDRDELLLAIIDELQDRRAHSLTQDERSWLRFLSEETGDPQIHRLIFNTRELFPAEILSVARRRAEGHTRSSTGFLCWILGPRPSRLGTDPMAPNNVVFRLRMLVKRSKDAPAMSADVDDVMNWLSGSELSHSDLDYLESDVRTWRSMR